MIKNSNVLITGGTGSLGKYLINYLFTNEEYRPKTIRILSRDEDKQYKLNLIYQNTIYKNSLQYVIGDVRSLSTIVSSLQDIDIVIHAAAMKQVPVCESFPYETVQTNIIGTQNIVSAIEQYGLAIKKVIGISTDKACDPINVYGMTKFIQEKILTIANLTSKKTDFISVRYGNVLGSRGSVIPLFQEQIKNGGPITVTDKNMTRFFFSFEDAVETIIAAIYEGNRGEILIPKIKSFSIMNIVKAMTQDLDIPIVFSGIRPGEKIHETLISDYEIIKTRYSTIKNKTYYIIDELLAHKNENPCLLKVHTSNENINTLEETRDLLKKVLIHEDDNYSRNKT